jgi:hypothetical protein
MIYKLLGIDERDLPAAIIDRNGRPTGEVRTPGQNQAIEVPYAVGPAKPPPQPPSSRTLPRKR